MNLVGKRVKMITEPSTYRRITSSKEKGDEGICQFEKDYPPEILAGCFLIAEEFEGENKNYFNYKVFVGGVDHFKQYVLWDSNSPQFTTDGKSMHYHEVISCYSKQKLRVDIDIEPDKAEFINVESMIIALKIGIANAIKTLWGVTIDEENFVICTSSGSKGNGRKESFHIIVGGYYIPESASLVPFLDLLWHDEDLEGYRDFIDRQIAGNLKNFRILGSSKVGGEHRIKRFYEDKEFTLEDTLITIISPNDIALESVARRRREETYEDTGIMKSDFANMMKLLKEKGYILNHNYRSSSGSNYYFMRTSPDTEFCAVCSAFMGVNKKHDRDNTFYINAKHVGDTIEVYQKCWRCTVPRSKIKLFSFQSIGGIYKEAAAGSQAGKEKMTASLKDHTVDMIEHDDREYLKPNDVTRVNKYCADKLQPFELVPTLCVLAGMKMGKTKELRRYIWENFPVIEGRRVPVIRFISFRTTFSSNIKQNFPEFVLYSDEKGSLSHPRLIIQVESLHRLDVMPQYKPDLVILDEAESIFEQFSSNLGKRSQDSWAKFEWLMHQAKHVIAMDAALSDRSVNMLRQLRCNNDLFLDEKVITVHYNEYKNATEDVYNIVTDRSLFHAMLYKDLAAGMKIAIPTSSKAEADILFELIPTHFPGIRINVYSSDTSKTIKNEHFGKVNEYWNQYTVILYTPTVSAGVSFEKQHFDKIYAWFTDSSCSVWACIQMLGRVRSVRTKQYVIGMNLTGGSNLKSTAADILEGIKKNRSSLYSTYTEDMPFDYTYDADGNIKIYETNFVKLWLENLAASNRSRNEFAKLFCYHVRTYGATVKIIEKHDFKYEDLAKIRNEDKAAIDRNSTNKVDAIVNAPDINRDQYIEMLNKFEESTVDESNIKIKYELRNRYDYNKIINDKWVRTYRSDAAKRHFKNLKALVIEPNPGEKDSSRLYRALNRIQDTERERFECIVGAKDRSLEINDVAAKYVYKSHRNALGLLLYECGYDGFFDRSYKSISELMDRILPRANEIIAAVRGIEEDRGLKPTRGIINLKDEKPAEVVVDADETDDDDDNDDLLEEKPEPIPLPDQEDAKEKFMCLMEQINKALVWMYGVKIVVVDGDNRDMYRVAPNDNFCYSTGDYNLRGIYKPLIEGLKV